MLVKINKMIENICNIINLITLILFYYNYYLFFNNFTLENIKDFFIRIYSILEVYIGFA
jgi:hypothetical protein